MINPPDLGIWDQYRDLKDTIRKVHLAKKYHVAITIKSDAPGYREAAGIFLKAHQLQYSPMYRYPRYAGSKGDLIDLRELATLDAIHDACQDEGLPSWTVGGLDDPKIHLLGIFNVHEYVSQLFRRGIKIRAGTWSKESGIHDRTGSAGAPTGQREEVEELEEGSEDGEIIEG